MKDKFKITIHIMQVVMKVIFSRKIPLKEYIVIMIMKNKIVLNINANTNINNPLNLIQL